MRPSLSQCPPPPREATVIEPAVTGVPIVYTYVLDPATKAYRDGEMFTGTIKAAAPFSVTVDLGSI